MSYLLNNQQKFNEIIFENRNKAYGAYAIRSAYGNTVFKSLLLISFFSCSLATIAYFSLKETEVSAVIIEQLLPPEISVIFETEKPKPDYVECATKLSTWLPNILPDSRADLIGLEQTVKLGAFGGITFLCFPQ